MRPVEQEETSEIFAAEVDVGVLSVARMDRRVTIRDGRVSEMG